MFSYNSHMASTTKPLNPDDPNYRVELGSRGGQGTLKKKGKKFFSRIAKKSHPRKEYRGGRPPGSKNKKKKPE